MVIAPAQLLPQSADCGERGKRKRISDCQRSPPVTQPLTVQFGKQMGVCPAPACKRMLSIAICFSFYWGQGMFDNLQYQTLHWFRFYFRFKVNIFKCKKFSRLSNSWTCRKLNIGSKLKIGRSTDKLINVGLSILSSCLLKSRPRCCRISAPIPPLLVCGSSQRSILLLAKALSHR